MAPPKTDKEKEKETQHLKRMLAMARKVPIHFGIALGKEKPEDLAFLAHQRRNPKSLRKQARAETGNSKGAHGEMTVDGKNLVFICQDSPTGPLTKAMRIFLRDLKVPLRAEFRLPDEAAGPAGAAPADGVPADGADDAAPAETAPADGADGAPDPRLPKMREEEPQVASGDKFARAYDMLRATLVKDLEGLAQKDPTAAAKIQKIVDAAAGHAAQENFKTAAKFLNAATKELAKAKATERAAEATELIPEGKVRDAVARLEAASGRWRRLRFRSIEGLDELIGALRADADPELHEIAGKVEVLTRQLPAEIEGELAALGKAAESRDPKAVAAQKAKVVGELKRCAGYLATHQKSIDRCKRNPFDISVDIRQPMVESLKEIQASLSAL